MAINNSIVSRIINEALQRVNQNGRLRTVPQALEQAWSDVNSRRLRGDCSENLAAAEHYLFARYLTATYGFIYYPVMNAGTWTYDMWKNISDLFSSQIPRESTCAPSSPSAEIRDWAYAGSCNGVDDAMNLTHVGALAAPSSPGSAITLETPGQVGDAISPNVG